MQPIELSVHLGPESRLQLCPIEDFERSLACHPFSTRRLHIFDDQGKTALTLLLFSADRAVLESISQTAPATTTQEPPHEA